MKDPAFLFYSNDYYEGTRTMLPEERACYIDLLIYQHQHNYIPNDVDRVLLYCNGISKATLEATLKAKFEQCDKGWFNDKLKSVIENRKIYSDKQSINGTIGQFWKKSKAILSGNEYLKLRESLINKSKDDLYNMILNLDINKDTLKGLLKASLKHLENENVIEIENENEINNINNNIKFKKEKIDFDFDFIENENPAFLSLVKFWLNYMDEVHKNPFTNQIQLECFYQDLISESKNDAFEAQKLINKAISNKWKGIYSTTNYSKTIEKEKTSKKFDFTPEEEEAILRDLENNKRAI